MKYKIQAFLSGRNGFDALVKTVMWAALIIMVLSSFLAAVWLRSTLYVLCLAALCYAYARAFSRDLSKRQAQNEKYLSWRGYHKLRFQQRKTHRIYRCPKCKQQLRVPKGKGRVSIACRSCGETFIKKT